MPRPPDAKSARQPRNDGHQAESSNLPPKLYFRIGEVSELVGVEPHVLRYWESEFRSVRPSKSSKGQRVYSRSDVESLLRVRDLLYREGFTIAGARKRLQRAGAEAEEATAATGSRDSKMRESLRALRSEIEAFLAELG
jgi:DNA-binding transcriptional MerR regulator